MGNQVTKKNTIAPWALFGLSILYCVSPIDIIPDIPFIGWIDDFFIATIGTLNLIQATCSENATQLSQIAKILKKIAIILGVIAIAVVVIAGSSLVRLFSN